MTQGTMLKVPWMGSKGDPLRRVLSNAADRACMLEYDAAILFSFIVEELAEEVSAGRSVRIPGFGMFSAHAKCIGRGPRKGTWISRPRFFPARGFDHQVQEMCPIDSLRKQGNDYYVRNHWTGPITDDDRKYAKARTRKAQRAWRAQIESQLPGGLRARGD
jgi:nucleoid DNA-binding protein